MKKLNTKIFIIKANKKHNNRYNYKYVNYCDSSTKIKILCERHGIFEQTPNNHLRGSGCSTCGKNKKRNNYEFIKEANLVHENKYDYSLVDYKNAFHKIKIICTKHGMFVQTPDGHLRGNNCPKCSTNKIPTTDEFISKSSFVHNNCYDYSFVEYTNNRKKIKIICPTHGIFEQSPADHLSGGCCPKCKRSKGELAVIKYLDAHHIDYIREKKFDDCKNKFHLRFDFYLFKYNILVEYDGRQHTMPIRFYGVSSEQAKINFDKILLNDAIKTNYAKKNNIKLLRISHEIKNIEEFLKNNLSI
jgi:hypothetical protein